MGETAFTSVDLAIGIVVLLSAIYAAWRGLVRETLAIFSWALAAYLTLRLFPLFTPMLRAYVAPDWLADFGVIIGLFLLILLPLSILSRRFAQMVQRTDIGSIDRALGFVFGAARGLVIVALAYILFSVLIPPPHQPIWLVQARFFPVLERTGDILMSMVPPREDMPLADLIVRPATEALSGPSDASETGPTPAVESDSQAYGAEERAALDRLIETTGAP